MARICEIRYIKKDTETKITSNLDYMVSMENLLEQVRGIVGFALPLRNLIEVTDLQNGRAVYKRRGK